ncbi:hypothetical protein OSTOST_05752 [Ostertagia ostertagi]
MTASLKTRKGIATRQAKALNDLLESYNHLANSTAINDEYNTENRTNQINNALVHIRATQTSFEKAFFAFAETVTSTNYPLVVKHLQEKYGNAFVIITNLHEQMEVCTARSTDLKDQCKLFDRLYSLTKQLESKGADLNSPWLMSKILAKFRDDIKRRVLEKKVALLNDQTWSMKTQMETLDKVLKQEEEIERHMPGTFEHQSTPRN